MPYDNETGEYFWTEEEQAWIANNQEWWMRNRKTESGQLVCEVRNRVSKEHVWVFQPDGGGYVVPTFKLGRIHSDEVIYYDHEYTQLRIRRRFNRETKSYDVCEIELKRKGGRNWRKKVPLSTKDVTFEKVPFSARLHIPHLQVTNSRGTSAAEFLIGNNIHVK